MSVIEMNVMKEGCLILVLLHYTDTLDAIDLIPLDKGTYRRPHILRTSLTIELKT